MIPVRDLSELLQLMLQRVVPVYRPIAAVSGSRLFVPAFLRRSADLPQLAARIVLVESRPTCVRAAVELALLYVVLSPLVARIFRSGHRRDGDVRVPRSGRALAEIRRSWFADRRRCHLVISELSPLRRPRGRVTRRRGLTGRVTGTLDVPLAVDFLRPRGRRALLLRRRPRTCEKSIYLLKFFNHLTVVPRRY